MDSGGRPWNCVCLNSGAVEVNPGAVLAHSEATEAHPGAIEAHHERIFEVSRVPS